ncbi:MAG: hypothetical protein ACRDQ7_07260, partial [Haloechinothrix sp.]
PPTQNLPVIHWQILPQEDTTDLHIHGVSGRKMIRPRRADRTASRSTRTAEATSLQESRTQTIPRPWLEQLKLGGVLVTPWGTDWSNGVMLTLRANTDGTAVGRFSGNLAFMRVRTQRRALYGWQPTQGQIDAANVSTTECRGADLDRMLNPELGNFAIGARLDPCCLEVAWDANGERRHVLELDHRDSGSWARLDADLTRPDPWQVRQLGPRRLWDEAETAYDWWHDQGEPGMDQFGVMIGPGRQWLWLEQPENVVRVVL